MKTRNAHSVMNIKTTVRNLARLLTLAALLVVGVQIHAADEKPPKLMTYTGYLVDGNGAPLGSANPQNFDIVFRIYNAETGGTLLWSEVQTVTVDNGNFSVLLGEGSVEGSEPRPDFDVVFSGNDVSDRFIGITVKNLGGSDQVILPRLRFLTSPFSMLANQATKLVNTGGGVSSVIGGGLNNAAPGTQSFVGGGHDNIADDFNSAVVAGYLNAATGKESFVGGGTGNRTLNLRSTIAGGIDNVTAGDHAFIGGGHYNRATNINTAIVGGFRNEASQINAFVGGGADNKATGVGSAVVGGYTNRASGYESFVGGGARNTASGQQATVAGGDGNRSSGFYSTVAGGLGNISQGDKTTVGGGVYNLADVHASTVGGGWDNHATVDTATVGGGRHNRAQGVRSTVAGGDANVASGAGSTVAGGSENYATHDRATVGGGQKNRVEFFSGTIAGGVENRIHTDHTGFIGGGFKNEVSGLEAGVVGGTLNKATAPRASVGGGLGNQATGTQSVVAGGHINTASGLNATVVGGYANLAAGAHSVAMGRRAKANHSGSFVFADEEDVDFSSSQAGEYSVRASQFRLVKGKMRIESDSNTTEEYFNGVPINVRTYLELGRALDGNHSWRVAEVKYDDNVAGFTDRGPLMFNFRGVNAGNGAAYHAFAISVHGEPLSGSDRRIKKDIAPAKGLLDRVKSIPTVNYRLRGTPNEAPKKIGVVAQDLEKEFPELVTDVGGIKHVNYSFLSAVAVGAVNELDAEKDREVAELKQENANLKAQMAEMLKRLQAVESKLNQ